MLYKDSEGLVHLTNKGWREYIESKNTNKDTSTKNSLNLEITDNSIKNIPVTNYVFFPNFHWNKYFEKKLKIIFTK